MNHVVTFDKDGNLVYEGILSSKEIANIDEIKDAVIQEIPIVEADLSERYGKGVLYKYYLGKFLGCFLNRYGITFQERRRFWDEIKFLAFDDEKRRKRDEGKNSVRRTFFEQCYVLSQIDIEAVQKLSWRQWQDLLDRVDNRSDERIFLWIKQKEEKIREDDWREFEKGLNMYLKNKDTSVFSDSELFSIYDSILEMSKYWRLSFLQFETDNPKSAKINSKAKRSKKYFSTCFQIKKDERISFSEMLYSRAFEQAMK